MSDCDIPPFQPCEQRLSAALSAYQRLMLGGAEEEVQYRDHKVKYTPMNMAALKTYIDELQAMCGTADTVLTNGPRRRAASLSFGNCGGRC